MYDEVEYTCGDCDIEIEGKSGDPQEGPQLNCPDCGEQMDYNVYWK